MKNFENETSFPYGFPSNRGVDIKGKSADSFFLLFMMVDPEGIGENFSFIPILALTGDLLMELEEGKDKQILARRGCDEANSP